MPILEKNKKGYLKESIWKYYINVRKKYLNKMSVIEQQYYSIYPFINYQNYCLYQVNTHPVLALIGKYLSFENLNKDVYLRSAMDRNGWVNLNTFTSLNRVKEMKITKEVLAQLITSVESQDIEFEVRRNEIYIRNRKWNEFSAYLNDIATIKNEKLKFSQNQYMCERKLYPRRNMRPMRSKNETISL